MQTLKNSAAPRALIGGVRADVSDPKALIGALQNAFEEFKKANDERLTKTDAVVNEKVEKIGSTVSELQAAVDQLAIQAAAAAVGADGKGRKLEDPDYSKAFAQHMKRGDIQASLNKGAADEGGYLAPVEWDRTITDKLVEVSPIRQIASVQVISTAGFKKVLNLRGTASGWVGETAARTETNTPEFGELTFSPGEIYASPAATQQMLDDAAIDLESWLANEVQTEFAVKEGQAFISGDGSNKPFGFLTYVEGAANAAKHPFGAVKVKTTAATTAFTSDELVDLVYMLPSVFRQSAQWVLNNTTLGVIRKMKDGDGNYLWQPSFQVGQPSMLLGHGVTEVPGMPDIAAGALPIAFGDFKRGYLIVDRTGTRVLRDPYSNKPYVHFYTTKRVGGGVQNPETIKVLKLKAA